MLRFAQVFPNFGVDEEDQWIMVPLGRSNLVLLKDGKGLRLTAGHHVKVQMIERSSHPLEDRALQLLKGDPNATLIKVTGVSPGQSRIDAKGSKRQSAQLKASVKELLLLQIAFHIVRHKTKSDKSTNLQLSDLDQIVKELNVILEPQANVAVVTDSVRPLEIDFDLNLFVGKPGHSTFEDLFRLGSRTGAVNVFFVKDFTIFRSFGEDVTSGFTGGKDSNTSENNVIVEDSSLNRARTVAHELLHVRGVSQNDRDHHNLSRNLVGSHPFVKIPSRIVDIINP